MIEEIIKELADSKLVKVTGSWADGTNHAASDIDLQVKDCNRDTKPEHIERVAQIFRKHGLPVKSNQPGHIFTFVDGKQIEAAYHFNKRPNKLPEVFVYGIKFKTH